MRDAADTFRRPPEPPTEEMWAEIEARAGLESSTPAVPIASITPRVQARRGFRIPSWVGIAATLVIGIGIGRGSTVVGRDGVPARIDTIAVAELPSAAVPRNDPALDRPYEVEASQYLGQTAAQTGQLQRPLHRDPAALGVESAVHAAVHGADATCADAVGTAQGAPRRRAGLRSLCGSAAWPRPATTAPRTTDGSSRHFQRSA